MADTRTLRIARIEAQIAEARQAYLGAFFADRATDANDAQREVDRLLDLWNRVQRDPGMARMVGEKA